MKLACTFRGLHARFSLLVAVTLLLMLQRQTAMQHEMAGLSRDSMHSMASDSLRAHGEAEISQLADTLTTPLYYLDLDAIGAITRNMLRRPDIAYVIVYDGHGDIVDDGTGDIPAFTQAMRDPLAYEVVSAQGRRTQWTDRVLDVSSPIQIGDQRMGGVRIGYSLAGMRNEETRAMSALSTRLGGIQSHHQAWFAAWLATLMALGASASLIVQRALVRPLRQLAGIARQFESGRYDVAVPGSQRDDEVSKLMRAFGRMGAGMSRHDRDIRRMPIPMH